MSTHAQSRPKPAPKARAHPLQVDPGGRRVAQAASVPAVWLDYTDLINYFQDNRMPTGIQRVQIELLRAAQHRPALGRPLCCTFDRARGGWVVVAEAAFAVLCEAACNAQPQADWLAAVTALNQTLAFAAAAPFAPGDVLVNIGSSWWIPDYMTHVRFMQRECGLLYAPFLHDCIPIRAPETCAAGLVAEFRGWFPRAVEAADMILANSACTARDVVAVAREMTGRTVAAHVVRLDARFADQLAHVAPASQARLRASVTARLGLARAFVLFVATVEARKNHIFVFEAWAALIARHGDAVPDLICVGKKGWLIEYTTNWLAVHPELSGRIRLIGTLSDTDLAVLYGGAAFTVYCSHYEGWGLPITESLSHGRVPVVPDHSSLPEAGGDLALYYEPGSRAGFCAQVERLLDPAERARLEADIAARFRPRAWGEVLEQLLDEVRGAPLLPGGTAAHPLAPGRLYRFGNGQGPGWLTHQADGADLRHGAGFHPAEPWGVWSSREQARLAFTLPRALDDGVFYAVLRGGPAHVQVRIDVGGVHETVSLNPQQRRMVRIDLHRSATDIAVAFTAPVYDLGSHTGGADSRAIGFGLEAVAVMERVDIAARMDVAEVMETNA